MSRSSFILASVVLLGCGGSVTETTDAGADGTADVKADVEGDARCSCLDAQLAWEQNGGLVAYVDRSTLSGCNDYLRRRSDPGSTTPTLECKTTLRACSGDYTDANDTWSVHDVNASLANADVKAAIAAAPVLYGNDPRAYDGTVFQVKIDGKVVEVGGDCGTTPGCKPIPAGVAALRDLLSDVDTKKQMVECAAFR